MWRTGRTAALVALFGILVWAQGSAVGDLAVEFGVPAFFIGLLLWIADLAGRGKDGHVTLNRLLVAGEDIFLTWGLWSVAALADIGHGVTALRTVQSAVAVLLFVAAVVCWTIGLVRGRRGIADEPRPDAWLVTAWQPLGALAAIAVIAGIAMMHVSLVLFGAAASVAAIVGGCLLELPERPASGDGEPKDRAYA